jgi:hypothetical protein
MNSCLLLVREITSPVAKQRSLSTVQSNWRLSAGSKQRKTTRAPEPANLLMRKG